MKDFLLIPGVGTVKKFITSLLAPLQTMTDNMKEFEAIQVKRSRWNGRKMVLQSALNEIFGVTSPPYIIVETNEAPSDILYFYEPAEDSPVYFSEQSENDPVYFLEPAELPGEDYDFIVLIPFAIYTLELERQIDAQTNIYKLAGPKFISEPY